MWITKYVFISAFFWKKWEIIKKEVSGTLPTTERRNTPVPCEQPFREF